MRYPASEKLEIIRLVEQSHLPAKCTLAKLGIEVSFVDSVADDAAPGDVPDDAAPVDQPGGAE